MNHRRFRQSGFTAVELLITMFIAATFLIAGYQLYGQVIRDGTDANNIAKVSARAYDRLREYSQTDQSSCSGGPIPAKNGTDTISGVRNVTYNITTTCVDYAQAFLKNVIITYTYTDSEGIKTIKHGMYVQT